MVASAFTAGRVSLADSTGRGATRTVTTYRTVLAVITLAGLALRIAGAQGGLWLDEAWSVLLAHDVGTPAGVFLSINHDNNHHLNSLWLQLVGMDAPSWVQRGLSIATGTLAIPLAAVIASRRGRAAALATALLFATAPILVTLGSEARGYAPMALALLVAMHIVDQALAGEEGGRRPTGLAIAVLLGTLSQLTMIFGLAALVGWALLDVWRREGLATALRRTVWLFGPAIIALAATLALLAGAAWTSPSGFHFGSYEPFTMLRWLRGVVEMLGYTLGVPVISVGLVAAALALLVLAPRLGAMRLPFHLLAIAGFPLSMALLHAANPGHPRYYLLAGIALLLLMGEVIGRALERPGRGQVSASLALAALVGAGLFQDAALATNRRGDPAAAVAALQARAPQGAAVLLDRKTGEAMLRVAAAQARYPLTIAANACPAPPFVFLDRFGGEVMPPMLTRCGANYTPIASRRATGLSGTHWTMYARRP